MKRLEIMNIIKFLLPDEYAKILKYQHGQKSIKLPYRIYVDFESIPEKGVVVKIIRLVQRKLIKIQCVDFLFLSNILLRSF